MFTHVMACAFPDPLKGPSPEVLELPSLPLNVPPGGSGWSDQFPGGLELTPPLESRGFPRHTETTGLEFPGTGFKMGRLPEKATT